MANITGIKVQLDTASDWWSPTRDALFLGVYSKQGGREFRLNGAIDLNVDDLEITLALGTSCCPTDSDVQVQYSTGLGVNDPLLNPIRLEDVEFVYLRKETAESTSVNDDQYKLDGVSVLMCDGGGNLRRFRKDFEINFSDEAGLQHWLGETSPPVCAITVTLRLLEHKDEDKKPAGFKWDFNFGMRFAGQTHNILPKDYRIKIRRKDEPDEWHRHFNLSHTVYSVGCCGQTPEIEVFGDATELDWTSRDDYGSAHRHHKVACDHAPATTTGNFDFLVKGQSSNRKSRIFFTYDITTQCLG